MIIIIEGCDGTGKTTLAHLLGKIYNLDIIHGGPFDPQDYLFYKQMLRKERAVWDRHFLSEYIYSDVLKRSPYLSKQNVSEFVEYIKVKKIVFFICDGDNEKIRKRILDRGNEPEFVTKNLDAILDAYRKFAKDFDIQIIDTENITYKEIIKIGEMYNNENI